MVGSGAGVLLAVEEQIAPSKKLRVGLQEVSTVSSYSGWESKIKRFEIRRPLRTKRTRTSWLNCFIA